jgi:HK97 family phage prohead protease
MHPPSSLLAAEFGERLVTLCDGRHGLRSGLQTQVLMASDIQSRTGDGSAMPPAAHGAAATLEFISSTAALDRFHEIISPEGWRLDHYRQNPVFQNAHQYGDIIFTLGKARVSEIRQVAGRAVLYQKIEFAVEANPMARLAYGLYKGKFLNAVSVGFIPLRWENGTAEAGYRRKYLEQELLEVSAVGIPANPEALQLGLRAGAIQKADVQELFAVLQQAMKSHSEGAAATPNPVANAPLGRSNGEQLLHLAHALNQILKRS